MAHLCVPQNQALGVCRGFVPDIQICGTHGRKDLVNATIISNVEEEEGQKWPMSMAGVKELGLNVCTSCSTSLFFVCLFFCLFVCLFATQNEERRPHELTNHRSPYVNSYLSIREEIKKTYKL